MLFGNREEKLLTSVPWQGPLGLLCHGDSAYSLFLVMLLPWAGQLCCGYIKPLGSAALPRSILTLCCIFIEYLLRAAHSIYRNVGDGQGCCHGGGRSEGS